MRTLAKFGLFVLVIVLLSQLVYAIDWSPQGNINLKDRYNITNNPADQCPAGQYMVGVYPNGSWNCTIVVATGGVDTVWDIVGPYVINNSDNLDINETILNNSIVARARVYYLALAGGTMGGDINMGSNSISNIGDVTASGTVSGNLLSGQLTWTDLHSYATTCEPYEYISVLGDTLTCANISIAEAQINDFGTYVIENTNVTFENISADHYYLSGFTNGSILYIDNDGNIAQMNSAFFFESDDGMGKLAVGSNAVMHNVFQAVKDESVTNIDTFKALISARNKNLGNGTYAGFTMQTKDTGGNVVSGARILTNFTSHESGAVSGDLLFDTRHDGTRSVRVKLSSDGHLYIVGLTNCDTIDTDANGKLVCGTDADTTYTENSPYLSLTDTVFGFVDSYLNNTIEDLSVNEDWVNEQEYKTLTEIVTDIGNWSLDEGNYYLKTEIDTLGEMENIWETTVFNNIDDFTGTLTDNKICKYVGEANEINCTYTAIDTTYTENSPYLSLTDTTFSFVESYLNNTIDSRGGGSGGNTTEQMQDAVMAAIDDGTQTHITVTYQDATNDMDFVVSDDWWDADGDISADEISEGKISFSTACGAGNHYYLSGNDLACEADDDTTYSENSPYLSLTTTTFSLVESYLNNTIDDRDTDTNTNANTECSGTTTYLDGEGNCDDISSVYQPLETTLTDIADGTINENLVNTANPWADNEVSDTLTVTGYMQDGDINTFTELQSWVSDEVLLKSGTLTNGKVCKYDSASTDIICNYDDAVNDGIYDCTTVNACTIDAESMEGTDWGTMTNAKWCVYDSVGTEVDCNVEPVVNTDTQDLSYDTATDVISLVAGGSIDITEVDTTCSATDACANIIYEDELNTLPELDTQIGTTGTASASTYLRGDNSWVTPTDTNTQLTEDQVEAYIFDNDNTANLNMSYYNVTEVVCIKLACGLKIGDC